MKLFKKYVLMNYQELSDLEDKSYQRALKFTKRDFKNELEALGDKLEAKRAEVKALTKKNRELQTEVEILNDERDDVREAIKLKMELDDKEVVLAAMKELQDKREAKLKDRENRLGTEEDKRYKEGYADGVADGVRKINEITAKDRENAMKVAMVAAASHSTPEVIKELNNGAKALGSGLDD